MKKGLSRSMLFLTGIILIFQIYIPKIHLIDLEIVPDILIIFITFIGFYFGRLYAIIIGFLLGFMQDLITQVEILGTMAFAKSVAGYGLGTLALYHNIWSPLIRTFFIVFIYLIHFFIYFFIKLNGTSIDIIFFLRAVIFHSLVSISILLIIDRGLINAGISTNNQ